MTFTLLALIIYMPGGWIVLDAADPTQLVQVIKAYDSLVAKLLL